MNIKSILSFLMVTYEETVGSILGYCQYTECDQKDQSESNRFCAPTFYLICGYQFYGHLYKRCRVIKAQSNKRQGFM
jgi:hypothetical protein